MKTLSVPVTESILDTIGRVQSFVPLTEVNLLEQAVVYGLDDLRKEIALRKYSDGELSFSAAVELAGLSVWEMMDFLVSRGVGSRLTQEDFEESLKNARELVSLPVLRWGLSGR